MDELTGNGQGAGGTASTPRLPISQRFELVCGLCLAVLAVVLAMTSLGAGRCGDDQVLAANETASAYSWYESKSVTQTVLQGQYDMLKALMASGSINTAQAPAIDRVLGGLYKDISRYKKEKSEILLGSKRVGRENWARDVGGKYGQVTGAKEWEARAGNLDRAGNVFDLAALLLQLCLVLGAISLVFEARHLRWSFFSAMLALGAAGTVISAFAFMQALKI